MKYRAKGQWNTVILRFICWICVTLLGSPTEMTGTNFSSAQWQQQCKPRFTNFWAGLRYIPIKFSNNKIQGALFFCFSPNVTRNICICHTILHCPVLREKLWAHIWTKRMSMPPAEFSSADWFTAEEPLTLHAWDHFFWQRLWSLLGQAGCKILDYMTAL